MSEKHDGDTIYFQSIYGDMDILEDLYQLCTYYYYNDPQIYLPYIYCLNAGNDTIIDRIHQCSISHNISMETLDSCVADDRHKLLSSNSREVRRTRVSEGPLIYIDGRLFIPSRGLNSQSLMSALCYVTKYPLSVFPWWVFGFLASMMISFSMISFIFRSWSFVNVIEWIIP